MVIYDCFDIFQLFLNLFVFRQCPLSIVSAMPTFLCNFSATPSFLLKMIFGYALFGYARFSFEVDFRLCSFRLCPLFVRSHFPAMPFVRLRPFFSWSRFRLCLFRLCPQLFFIFVFSFSAPVCQSLKCDWRWGEVFLCFHGICAFFPPTIIF